MVLTRGFAGRSRGARDPGLPPGQYDAGMDWPALHVEPTPSIDTAGCSFEIDGLVDKPVRWSWEEIHALPASRYEGAIHCVTTWRWQNPTLNTPPTSGSRTSPAARPGSCGTSTPPRWPASPAARRACSCPT